MLSCSGGWGTHSSIHPAVVTWPVFPALVILQWWQKCIGKWCVLILILAAMPFFFCLFIPVTKIKLVNILLLLNRTITWRHCQRYTEGMLVKTSFPSVLLTHLAFLSFSLCISIIFLLTKSEGFWCSPPDHPALSYKVVSLSKSFLFFFFFCSGDKLPLRVVGFLNVILQFTF